ncbi:sigma-E factor negative regulatory protein [Leeia oryzae]|uniref:sigma-E factor negative regulatory protein n=1 Tax=Leeia oryzae TaxID=356662 RepID=UPI00039DE975|nr:sigma-E factor negative regulatory protein [Leeia oryzae]
MNERISALMDGELLPEEEASVLEWLRHHPDGADVWNAYHLIGDSMRQSDYLASNIRARVASRLSDEVTILAPQSRRHAVKRTWVALSAAASVATVSIIGLVAYQRYQQVENPQAVVTAQVTQATGTFDMSPYLAAHQQYAAQVGGRPQVLPAAYDNGARLNK